MLAIGYSQSRVLCHEGLRSAAEIVQAISVLNPAAAVRATPVPIAMMKLLLQCEAIEVGPGEQQPTSGAYGQAALPACQRSGREIESCKV